LSPDDNAKTSATWRKVGLIFKELKSCQRIEQLPSANQPAELCFLSLDEEKGSSKETSVRNRAAVIHSMD
jgi:hypothetical protein